jgi:hypothetical protein
MSAAPLGSENAKAKVCDEPLPEFGVTEIAEGPVFAATKEAVSLIGPSIVTDALAVVPVNEPAPVPLQPANTKPVPGVALMGIVWPALDQLLTGLTVPPVPAFIVRKY